MNNRSQSLGLAGLLLLPGLAISQTTGPVGDCTGAGTPYTCCTGVDAGPTCEWTINDLPLTSPPASGDVIEIQLSGGGSSRKTTVGDMWNRANHTSTQDISTITGVDSDIATLVLPASTTISTWVATNVLNTASAAAFRTAIGVGTLGTLNTITGSAYIDAGAVEYSDIQNVTASRLLGRGSAAGAGPPVEVTLGTNLSWSGTTINASGGGSSQLSDLSDVNTSTPTNRNVLVADGVDFESRALVEADVSDLSHYADADVSTYLTGGTGITEAAGTISFDCSEVEGTGINCTGESVTLDATGDWTGTFDGQEGSYYLATINATTITGNAVDNSTLVGTGANAAGYVTLPSCFDESETLGWNTTTGQWVCNEDAGAAGGASQLSDLSDVNTSTPTNRYVLVADGVDFESRALVEADISDLSIDLTSQVTGDLPVTNQSQVATNTVRGRYTAATGDLEDFTATNLTEEVTPATGDFLLGWESGGGIRKFDVGDLPAGSEVNDLETDGALGITDGEVFIGTATPGEGNYAALSGDIGMTSAGVTTIQTDAVETGMVLDGTLLFSDFANIGQYTVMGRALAASGVMDDIGVADLTEEATPATGDFLLGWDGAGLLKKFDVGDLPAGSEVNDLETDGALGITDGEIFIGGVTGGQGTYVAVTGDISLSNGGVTAITANAIDSETMIADGTITFADRADIKEYALLGRLASGSGVMNDIDETDLTEETTPATGDFLVGWDGTGVLKKFDVGDMPGTGDVNVSGSPVDEEIAVWTNGTTIEGRTEIPADQYVTNIRSGVADPDSPWTPAYSGESILPITALAKNLTINTPTGTPPAGRVFLTYKITASAADRTITFSGYTTRGNSKTWVVASGATEEFVVFTDNAGTTWYLVGAPGLGDLADVAQYTVLGRESSGSGDINDMAVGDLTEEATPATGDFLLGWDGAGLLKKFDVGDLPAGSEVNNLEIDGAASIADTEVFIGTGAGTGNYAAFTGDISLTNAGVTAITADAIDSSTMVASGTLLFSDFANIGQYTVMGRALAASGVMDDIGVADLTEEATPATGDFLLGWDGAGLLKKFDVGDLPSGSPGEDTIGTTELDDDANTPVADYVVIVETGAASFDYAAQTTIVSAANVGAASANLDDTDASVEWEDATALTAAGQLDTGAAVADTAFADLTTGSSYTNFGGATDDTIDELFAALDSSWPTGGGDVSVSGTPSADQLAVWTSPTAIEGEPLLQYDTTADRLYVGDNAGTLTYGDFGVFEVSRESADNLLSISVVGGAGDVPGINTLHARGTYGAETATQSDDIIYFMGGRGHTGSSYGSASQAAIRFAAQQTHTATNNGTYITIETTPNDSTTRAENVRINEDGVFVTDGDIRFDEKADHNFTPTAGDGYLWVKNTAPNTLIYTNDSGTDTTLGVTAASVGAVSDNLDDTDASVEWEDATDLDLNGALVAGAVSGGSGGDITDNTVDASDIDETDDYTFTGTIGGKLTITLDTAATVDLSSSSNAVNAMRINNDNDVIDYTLPPAEAGLNICFYSLYAAVVTIDPDDTADTIYLDGASVGAGDAIDSPGTAGDFICLVAIDATRWLTLGRSGTWVDGGAD